MAESEVERLRKFVEGVVELCAWGRAAFIEEDGGSVQDAAVRLGLLVPIAHAQPCAIEGCECDGATSLFQFAWRVPETLVPGAGGLDKVDMERDDARRALAGWERTKVAMRTNGCGQR